MMPFCFSYLPPKLYLCYLTSLKTVDDYFTLYFNKDFFTSLTFGLSQRQLIFKLNILINLKILSETQI